MKIAKGTIVEVNGRTFKVRIHFANFHSYLKAWQLSTEPKDTSPEAALNYLITEGYFEELPCLPLTLSL